MSSTPAYREHYCIVDSALHGVHKPIGAKFSGEGDRTDWVCLPPITRPLRWFQVK